MSHVQQLCLPKVESQLHIIALCKKWIPRRNAHWWSPSQRSLGRHLVKFLPLQMETLRSSSHAAHLGLLTPDSVLFSPLPGFYYRKHWTPREM